MSIEYQWDPLRPEANRRKHGVEFADAVAVFSDEAALTMPDDYPDEERYVTMGEDILGRLLVVIYTWRGDSIRIISAREASARERQYYQGNR